MKLLKLPWCFLKGIFKFLLLIICVGILFPPLAIFSMFLSLGGDDRLFEYILSGKVFDKILVI